MPRVAREKSESGYYHIVFRGINKQTIFYDDEDRRVFLNRLKLIKEKNNYTLLAFCLMTNHVHLLVKEEDTGIGAVIRRILSSYVYWYNSKYERIGNLFQDRFRSEPIGDDAYLLCCARYILQNPVKAHLCESMWEYRWSNAGLLLNPKGDFVNAEQIISMFAAQQDLIAFFEEMEERAFLEGETKISLTDERLKQKIEGKLKNCAIQEIMEKNREERDKILREIMAIEGASVLQVSRITGVPYHVLRRLE